MAERLHPAALEAFEQLRLRLVGLVSEIEEQGDRNTSVALYIAATVSLLEEIIAREELI